MQDTNRVFERKLALDVLKILTGKFEQTQAFKLGLIDKNGNPLKKENELKTQEERNAFTMLDRLIFKVKQFLDKNNLWHNKVPNYTAGLALIRESYVSQIYPDQVDKLIPLIVEELEQRDIREFTEIYGSSEMIAYILREDGEGAPASVPANSTGPAVAGTGDDKNTILTRIFGKTMLRRKKP
jgi:hypothetical protein